MTDLSGFFDAERVAVVGATPRPNSIGRALASNLLDAFAGDVVPVNPNRDTVLGVRSVPGLAEAGPVDLAVVAIPAAAVPDVLREAGEAGVRNVVVVSAGFSDRGERGAALEDELRGVAEEYGTNLLGPNSLRVISTPHDLTPRSHRRTRRRDRYRSSPSRGRSLRPRSPGRPTGGSA